MPFTTTGTAAKLGGVAAGVVVIVLGLVLAALGAMAMGAPSTSSAVILVGLVVACLGVWLLASQLRRSNAGYEHGLKLLLETQPMCRRSASPA